TVAVTLEGRRLDGHQESSTGKVLSSMAPVTSEFSHKMAGSSGATPAFAARRTSTRGTRSGVVEARPVASAFETPILCSAFSRNNRPAAAVDKPAHCHGCGTRRGSRSREAGSELAAIERPARGETVSEAI